MRLERVGKKKKELKNLAKRGGVWYFRNEQGGKVTSVSLQTGDLELAKARRDELKVKIIQEKWEVIDQVKSKRNLATIGEICERYLQATDLQISPDTMNDYVWALKHLVKKAKGLDAVEGLPCTVLDKSLVREWQRHCLNGNNGKDENDKLAADRAAITSNSILAQARSLFSKRAMARDIYKGLNLCKLEDFMKAPVLNTLKRDNYVKPAEEVLQKIWKAAYELRDGQAVPGPNGGEIQGPAWKRPALWVMFWLFAQSGLRRQEVWMMRWRWFIEADGQHFIRTCFENDFVPKGKRERDVPIAPGVIEECRRIAKENSWAMEPHDYVLPGSRWQKEKLSKEFGRWMTEQGWTRRQKAHELRKIFASDLTEAGDPYDTQRALGHQDIKTTMRYAARRKVAAVDMAARYANPPKITVLPDPPEEKAA